MWLWLIVVRLLSEFGVDEILDLVSFGLRFDELEPVLPVRWSGKDKGISLKDSCLKKLRD